MLLRCLMVLILVYACKQQEIEVVKTPVSGVTDKDANYLTIGDDTLTVRDRLFSDSLDMEVDRYAYLKLDTWKWPRIIYLEKEQSHHLNFTENWITTAGSDINEYLLNRDSILQPYSARWNMDESEFTQTWEQEFPHNLLRIDSFFSNKNISSAQLKELKQMEYFQRAHRTANFISFQEKKGKSIDRSIYAFVDSMELNNDRLDFHVNNRNFQFYYYTDKIPDSMPDTIYPFAVIDTVMNKVSSPDIRSMIISLVVKSGLYDDTVDHDALFARYKNTVGEPSGEMEGLYEKIQKLKPGNPAPSIGSLIDKDGVEKNLEDFEGKNILLSVWGTWCPYCKEELPHLMKLQEKFSDKIVSVAISLDTEEQKWKEFIREKNWTATHLMDPDNKSVFQKNYLINGTNVHYLIDKKGGIVASGFKPSDERVRDFIEGME